MVHRPTDEDLGTSAREDLQPADLFVVVNPIWRTKFQIVLRFLTQHDFVDFALVVLVLECQFLKEDL